MNLKFVLLAGSCALLCQGAELLWPNGAPGALGSAPEDQPSITVYAVPEPKNTGTAVVVCPGGGYAHLAMDHEGEQIAKWLTSFGVNAFVLKYRLGPKYHHPIELGDAQRAIRWVRSNAAKYRIAPDRIGVWGFSAGGHLASSVSTHFDTGNASAADPIDRVSCRPDFSILSYAVISFTTPYTHKGSMRNLLGDNPPEDLVRLMSNEVQVTAQTPPTFLFHTTADKVVPVENSILYYMALRQAGVPAEMHIYENGPHGIGLGQYDLALSSWPRRLEEWMLGRGLIRR